MKLDQFEGTMTAYLSPNENHPSYEVEIGEFGSGTEADEYLKANPDIINAYPAKHVCQFGSSRSGHVKISLIENDTKEEIGIFESIEALNEYITSSRLPETRPDRVINLQFNGLCGGRYPLETAYVFSDCSPISAEAWADVRKWVEEYAAIRINTEENEPLRISDGMNSVFHLTMFVYSPEEELIYKGEYMNFFRVNEFIRSTMEKPEYAGADFLLAAFEILDDIPRAISHTFFFDTYEVIPQKDIDDMVKHMVDACDEWDDACGGVRTPLRPDEFEEVEDCTEKETFRSEYTYICPTCLHELDDCRCGEYPEQLVRIDTILLPTIRELNSKLYRTAFSCAGHQPGVEMYISFQHWYDIVAPEGFHYSYYDFSLFRPCPDGLSDEEYQAFRQESADTLLKWAQELPECPWPDGL